MVSGICLEPGLLSFASKAHAYRWQACLSPLPGLWHGHVSCAGFQDVRG